MSAVWNGQRIEIPRVVTRSWMDTSDPRRPPRTVNCYTNVHGGPGKYEPSMVQPITGITWHAVHGTATGEVTEAQDSKCVGENGALANAKYFAKETSEASSHFVLADNGAALVLADLITNRTWHAGAWNPFTIGIEIDQSSADAICTQALATSVHLAWWLCAAFGVQPMLPFHNGAPDLGDIPQLVGGGAKNFRGHYFHAAQAIRGRGDPGPALPWALHESGFEGFDVRAGQDILVWKARQKVLGMPLAAQDGIPGVATVAAMRAMLGRPTWAVRKPLPPELEQEGPGLFELALAAGMVAGGIALYRRYRRRKRA